MAGIIFPPTNRRNRPWVSRGQGTEGQWGEWPDAAANGVSSKFSNYAIMGVLTPWVSGPTDWIPKFYVRVASSLAFVGVRASIHAGTSATCDIYHGGTLLSALGLSGIVVTTTDTFFPASSSLNVTDGDTMRPQLTAISGAPDGLTMAFLFDETQ